MAYDIIYTIADAMKRAGKYDGKSIRDALEQTKDLQLSHFKLTMDPLRTRLSTSRSSSSSSATAISTMSRRGTSSSNADKSETDIFFQRRQIQR